jgi:tetratricopeptide (TPR) repeat protein
VSAHAVARADGPTIEEELRAVTERLREEISPEHRARLMSRAGELCFAAGSRERALLYFDACIDLYLSIGRFAASAAICEKLVRLNPAVVRARCTLAWLAIARELEDEAQHRIEEYGTAALRLERPTVAQRQLRAMAEEVDSEGVLESIAQALLRLGDTVSADRVFAKAHSPSARRRRQYATNEDRERAIISRLTTAWSG